MGGVNHVLGIIRQLRREYLIAMGFQTQPCCCGATAIAFGDGNQYKIDLSTGAATYWRQSVDSADNSNRIFYGPKPLNSGVWAGAVDYGSPDPFGHNTKLALMDPATGQFTVTGADLLTDPTNEITNYIYPAQLETLSGSDLWCFNNHIVNGSFPIEEHVLGIDPVNGGAALSNRNLPSLTIDEFTEFILYPALANGQILAFTYYARSLTNPPGFLCAVNLGAPDVSIIGTPHDQFGRSLHVGLGAMAYDDSTQSFYLLGRELKNYLPLQPTKLWRCDDPYSLLFTEVGDVTKFNTDSITTYGLLIATI